MFNYMLDKLRIKDIKSGKYKQKTQQNKKVCYICSEEFLGKNKYCNKIECEIKYKKQNDKFTKNI